MSSRKLFQSLSIPTNSKKGISNSTAIMKGVFAFIVIFFCFSQISSLAQTIDNVRVKFEDGGIVVYYDIRDTDPSKSYDFFLYGSHDNYQRPLIEVSGDVGQKVTPGSDRRILWDARKEFGNFKGDINLKIKGSIHTPLLTFNTSAEHQKIKKSKPLIITWTSSSKFKDLYFEVVNNSGDNVFGQEIENIGTYTWMVPKECKTGKGYQIKVSAMENPLIYEKTDPFSISNKTPLLLKVAPIVVVGAGYLILSGGNDKNTGDSDNGVNGIPDPPSNP